MSTPGPVHDWPLVERYELLDEIRRTGRSCVLVGPGGVGKSTAARLALGPDATSIVVTGLEGMSSIPFAALHLAEMTAGDAGPSRADVDAVVHLQSWLDRIAAEDVAIIIDDPAHLDPEGAALLADHLRRGNPVTITHRPEQPPAAALRDACDAAGLVTIEISPFDDSMVALAVELALGLEPTDVTVEHLAALSGGNPMLLREIMRDLTIRNQWVELDGRIGIALDADPSDRLAALLGARLPTDSDEISCLELIAHAGSIARALATRVASESSVDALVTSGWVVGDDALTIAHPLMAQFVADRLDPVHRRRRLGEALERIGPAASLDATSRLQCLRWSFTLDRAVPRGELRWGRSEASRRFDSDLACLIADRLSHIDPNVDTTLELALVLAQAERYDEVVSVLRAGQHQAGTAAEVVDIARFLLHFTGALARLRRLGDPPEGLEDEVAAWADDRLSTTAFTDLKTALDLVAVGRLDDACAKADEVRAAGISGLGDADELAMVCSLYSGNERRAMEAFGRLERWLSDPAYRHPKVVVIDAAASSLLMLAGLFEQAFEFDGTIAEVARATNDHGRAREMTGHQGMTALFTGRVDASIEAFTFFRAYPSPPGSLRTLYTAGLAHSLALAGRLPEAERVLAEAEREAGTIAPLMFADYETMVAVTLALLGHAEDGETRLRGALQFSIENHIGRSELMGLHALTRIDRVRPADIDRVAVLPPNVTSGSPGFTAAVLAMVDATYRRDPGAMARSGDQFAATDFGIGAAEAYAAACRAAVDPRASDALASRRRLGRWLDRCPGLVGATVLVEHGGDRLTDRERQIAALAAGGLANPAIADRLGLSVRTIENTLHRGFTKLGITTRAEIRAALLPPGAIR